MSYHGAVLGSSMNLAFNEDCLFCVLIRFFTVTTSLLESHKNREIKLYHPLKLLSVACIMSHESGTLESRV